MARFASLSRAPGAISPATMACRRLSAAARSRLRLSTGAENSARADIKEPPQKPAEVSSERCCSPPCDLDDRAHIRSDCQLSTIDKGERRVGTLLRLDRIVTHDGPSELLEGMQL